MSQKKPSSSSVPHYLKISPVGGGLKPSSKGAPAAPALDWPQIEAPSTENIEVRVAALPPPTEGELITRFTEMKRAALPYRDRKLGEAMALGDELQIDTFASIGKNIVPQSFRAGVWLQLAPNLMALPGLAELMTGRKIGEKLAFGVTVPPTYPIAALRGQDINVFISVLAGREMKELADESPELLKRMNRGKTLAEVMASIRTDLLDEIADVMISEGETRVLGELAERAKIDVTAAQIDREIDLHWQRLEGDPMKERGFDEASLESARQGWLNDARMRADAELRVRVGLVMRAIAQRDELTLTPEKLNEVLLNHVPDMTEAKIHEALNTTEELAEQIVNMAGYLMAVDHVLAKAKVHYGP